MCIYAQSAFNFSTPRYRPVENGAHKNAWEGVQKRGKKGQKGSKKVEKEVDKRGEEVIKCKHTFEGSERVRKTESGF